jgi:lipopolysaccharide transport system ATP-binding protein
MKNEISVSVQDLSKLYLLYKQPQDRLKQSLFGRLGKNYAQTFWALQDISFEIKPGETFGIIGRNGSGKSTLLQIIAGVLQPTKGQALVYGRLAALLELGAGFNPEFTGRENIFLNGATLGIPEKEMRQKLGTIIDFADIGDFIDQPVKIYSSGMFVRLAIATSVEPDVLIIDEALAVGDTGFVMKCMNHMKKMRASGTTILLVTHDVQTIRSFCDRAIWLDQGRMQKIGDPLEVSSQYLQYLFGEKMKPSSQSASTPQPARSSEQDWIDLTQQTGLVRWGSGEIRLEACQIYGNQNSAQAFEHGERLTIQIKARALQDLSNPALGFGFALRNIKGLDIITATTLEQSYTFPALKTGQVIWLTFELDNILGIGDYALVLNIEDRSDATPHYYDFVENAELFKVFSYKPIFSLVLPPIQQAITIESQA